MRTPNLFVIGAPRAGTTSLYTYLATHPQIFMSPIKEPNYFAQTLFTKAFFRNRRKPPFDLKAYLAGPMTQQVHFAYLTEWDDYIGLFRNVRSERVIGEASTFYLQCPDAPLKIKQASPQARILVLLRDPVERAYSEYRMNLALGIVRESFASAIERQFSEGIEPGGLVAGSLYYNAVTRYLETFGPDRVLVLLHSDVKQRSVFQALCRFLGVDQWRCPGELQLNSAMIEPRSRGINFVLYQSGLKDQLSHLAPMPLKELGKRFYYSHHQPARLAPEERTKLARRFHSDIASLQDLLGRDLSGWLQAT
jgi:hypothetical protein